MAWETRNGRRYYYRKVRKGGRVFSVYEGGGLSGTLTEEQDREARVTRQREAEDLRSLAAREDRIDGMIDRAWGIAREAERAALEAAGYHLHKREWRFKRNGAG